MKNETVIPETYQQWRYCIETLGGIELTTAYVNGRLTILQNGNNAESKLFAKLYGKAHLQRTVEWFHRAANEMS